MPLIAFDSNICIWCIKEECTPGQETEMQDAIKLKKLLTKAGYDILIPIPVVSELLSNVPDVVQRQELFNEIRKTFQIGEFDVKASLLLAEILNYHFITSGKQYQTLGITKTALKYDALIVAVSKAHGAECLFAHDPDCKKIAVHFLPVKTLNERPDSISQFIGVFEEQSEREIALQIIEKALDEVGETDIQKTPSMSNEPLPKKEDEPDFPAVDKVLGQLFSVGSQPKFESESKENDNEQNKEENGTETTPGELPTEIGD